MNERLEELAVNAGIYGVVDINGKFENEAEVRKFAELLVQECLEAAAEPADGLIKGDTWHDGVRASYWSIKQRFGVE